MQDIHTDKILNIIQEASARFILPRYKALKNNEIHSKTSPNDLVTLADIEAEAFLERVLPTLLPGSLVIGEEGVSRGDHNLDALKQHDKPVWVVDPVDGTYNFVHGGTEFGVMIALVKAGRTIAGWIYDVLNDSLAYAHLGEGAYIDGARLSTPVQEKSFDDMVVHLSAKFFPADIRRSIQDKAAQFGNVHTVGSAAHEYIKIAKGLSDSAVYCRLKPWDHLPGALIVQEAGGIVSKWDGGVYTPNDHYDGLIAARTKKSWNTVQQVFFADMDIETYMRQRQERLDSEDKP